jgi:hypothetical protein
MALRSTHPLTVMNTINLTGVEVRPARKVDSLSAIWSDCLENVGASKCDKPIDLNGLLPFYFVL